MLRIYHNPRCSKSRAALTLLQERGLTPDVVEYLKTPPDAGQLATLLKQLGIPARALLRSGEAIYRELGLDDPALGEDALIAAMAAHPILIERPIVVRDGKAVIGRPPENILSIV